jgi:STE24 endopeptidase
MCLMRLQSLLLLCCLLLPIGLGGCSSATTAETVANNYATNELAAEPVNGNLPDYSLTPERLAKAQHLQTTGVTLNLAGQLWSIVQLLLLLAFGGIAWMRDVAVRASAQLLADGKPVRAFFRQCFFFFVLFSIAGLLLDLPLAVYLQHLERAYHLSVQSWASWSWDLLKSFVMSTLGGVLVVALLMFVIRRFPSRWWLVFSGLSIPLMIFLIFVGPYIGFLYNQYEPLDLHHHDLVVQLERVCAKGHMVIPPSRMYLMKASAKVNTMNADVEGFGASKRVVVWDTTADRLPQDEVIGIFGHESGHYVLHHVEQIIYASVFLLFIIFWLGNWFLHWTLARFGGAWRIPSQSDWGAIAVLALGFSLFTLLGTPIANAISRQHEHAADVYGQEAIHGIVSDPQATMQGVFDDLGNTGYSVPNKPLWIEYWLGTHPQTGRRAAFAHAYNPWVVGYMPKYFSK